MSTSFSKSHVDKLVKCPKFITSRPIFNSPSSIVSVKIDTNKCQINLKGEIHLKYIKGVGPSLEYCGIRIRGINYEMVHKNPDGSEIYGWHEHIWKEEFQDHFVIPVPQLPNRKCISDENLLDFCLKKWNIEYRGPLYKIKELFKNEN